MTGTSYAQERTPRVVETSDFVAFLRRIIHAYGDRIAQDPVALVHLRDLELELRTAVNRGVFEANRGQDRYSQNEMADLLDVSRQAIAKRIKAGEQIYLDEQLATADGGALVRLADVRERRAELLAKAAVEDRTGSPKERTALTG